MRKRASIITVTGVGAGLMYFLDSQRGKDRRSEVKEKVINTLNKSSAAADKVSTDLAKQLLQMRTKLRSTLRRAPINDDVLKNRLQAKLKRFLNDSGMVDVTTEGGHVQLRGAVRAQDVNRILRRIFFTRGIASVENQLEVTGERHAKVPGREAAQFLKKQLLEKNWSAKTRLVMGAVGGVAGVYGLQRQGLMNKALGAAGLVMLARAATNKEIKHMLPALSGSRSTEQIKKTMTINAPVDKVFELWANFENFPLFMSHVKSVRALDEQRWRWTVTGLMGASVEWNAVVTAFEPNSTIGWRTEEDSPVEHEGLVKFTSNTDGTTTIDLKMTYNAIAGMGGNSVAHLLGIESERQIDEDLIRLKAYVEAGRLLPNY